MRDSKNPPDTAASSRWWIGRLIRGRSRALAFGLGLILVNRAASLALPLSMQFIIDKVITERRPDRLLVVIMAVLAAACVQAATGFSLTHVLAKGGQRLVQDLRRELHTHLVHLPQAVLERTKVGMWVARIMQDAEAVRYIVDTGLVELCGSLLTAAIAALVLMWISPLMTVIALSELSILAVIFRLSFRTVQERLRRHRALLAQASARLIETFAGIRVVKSYRTEARESAAFHEHVEQILENMLRSLTATGALAAAVPPFVGLVGATVLWLGAARLASGELSLGSFFSYIAVMGYMINPIVQMVSVGRQLGEGAAALERAREALLERREDDDPERTVVLREVVGHVAFERVTFAYETGGDVLREISFQAAPGSVTALVGPSGSGKSTAIGLLSAMHKACAGSVRIDGVDLARVQLDAYRGHVAVVHQETFLFDGTLRENILMARPNATERELREVCRLARVDELLCLLECGLDTRVGERGVRLSGGQRQRIAIARALLADPRILVLDEATSNLDAESEQLIQSALWTLMRNRTSFVIAHRLRTIRDADQILVLERGRIVEHGQHDALMVKRGRYYEQYLRQQDLDTAARLLRESPYCALPDVRP